MSPLCGQVLPHLTFYTGPYLSVPELYVCLCMLMLNNRIRRVMVPVFNVEAPKLCDFPERILA